MADWYQHESAVVDVYCASPRAIRAAALAYYNSAGQFADTAALAAALIAAHHPGLGLDRSVCLGDIKELPDGLTALGTVASTDDGLDAPNPRRAVRAPFTDLQRDRIAQWQRDPNHHTLTCLVHSDRPLAVSSDDLYCRFCSYTQDWVPEIALEERS
jgi:hypothetical protein